jgi:hypothetical protein
MTKFVLTMWVCSFLSGTVCSPPVERALVYNSWYECARAAHRESLKLLSGIGYKKVNEGMFSTRYTCKLQTRTSI